MTLHNNAIIPEILRTNAENLPNKPAYIFLTDGENSEDIITFSELYSSALQIAGQLNEAVGERVLMLFSPGLDFIKALYGCFLAGAIAVPAYPPRKNRSLERIKTLVVDSGAKFVISTPDIYDFSERAFADLTELKSMKWILPNETPLTDNIPLKAINPDDIALLQYTSGSTGNPKGVMVSHKNIVCNLEFIRQSFNLTPESVSVSWLPAFHDMGLIDAVIGAVYNGYTSVLMAPVSFIQKPSRWLKAITKYKGTHGGAPNFAFDLCVDGVTDEEKSGIDLSSMDTMYCGAEPIRKETFDRFLTTYSPYGITKELIYPCYGMAETTLIISGPSSGRGPVYLNISASDLEKNNIIVQKDGIPGSRYMVGVGYPWIDTIVKIVDPDKLEELPENKVGEIWVSGSIVTQGYWKNKKVTDETFHADLKGGDRQYMRTGDLGFFNNGELYITGRLKDVIILHGVNHYPQDIELVAEQSHEALMPNASAAFSVMVDGIEKLVIVAEVKRSFLRNLDVEGIADAIRQTVSDEFELEVYAVQLLRTASILKTSSGKIQRKACRQGFLDKCLEVVGESLRDSGVQKDSQSETDATSIQAWLMAWIHLKLGVPLERIDTGKNISAYGLNSLRAVQLQQDFLQKYSVNIPPYVFFDKMTVKDLSEKAWKMLMEARPKK